MGRSLAKPGEDLQVDVRMETVEVEASIWLPVFTGLPPAPDRKTAYHRASGMAVSLDLDRSPAATGLDGNSTSRSS